MQRVRNDSIVFTACLVPGPGLPAEELVELARKCADAEPIRRYLGTLGAAQYRAGQYPEAVATLEKALKAHGQVADNEIKLFLAMACHHHGQVKQARAWFGQASLPKDAPWYDRVIFTHLRHEAAKVLRPGP
jgi:hypothetical protein